MPNLRQLETLLWIARLGTHERAARRLNMTQSTMSKRMQELELACGFPLFNKRGRHMVLTDQGARLAELAERMVDLHQEIEAIRTSTDVVTPLVIGVTELSAQTWLPRVVRLLRSDSYRGTQTIHVDHAHRLIDMLDGGQLDLAVCRDVKVSRSIVGHMLAKVEFELVASAKLIAADQEITRELLCSLAYVSQGPRENAADIFSEWLLDRGLIFERSIRTDSVAATVGLLLAEQGVSLLPKGLAARFIEQERLVALPLPFEPPTVSFFAYVRRGEANAALTNALATVRENCDFSRFLQM
nr:LysR family transcriptional regulator [uncultured Shinella sp.]